MCKMEDNNQIIDAENFRNIKSYGYKDIMLRQLQKVVTNMSQEMRKGFWIKTHPSPNMSSEKVRYVGDSRKELRQSIDTLHDLLLPKFDDEMKKHSERLYDEFEKFKTSVDNKQVTEKEEKDFWDVILKIYRKLFQQLCLFLERMGWLETENVEDE